MRLSRVTAFLIGFCSVLLLCGAAARGAEPTKSERELKAALAPHGDWLYVDGWGDVWSPQDAFFRPYARGHWTVDGGDWTYHGNSDWEELTAHYGHWVDDPLYGWLWRPDGVWKPSAVAWRLGRDYVGWAPLGPAGSVPKNPVDWVFVRGVDAVAENLQKKARAGSVDLFEQTRPLASPPTELAVLGLPEPALPSAGASVAAVGRSTL